MTIEESVTAHLLADPGVSALIGDRIYPGLIPQDASRPALGYQSLPGPGGIRGHDGPFMRQARIQFTSQADKYGQAKALANAIRTSLWGFGPGVMGGGVIVHDCEVNSDLDGYNQPTGIQTVRLDAIFLYSE